MPPNEYNNSAMTPERWRKVKEILAAALDLQPAHRESYIERACSNDLSLRQAVDSLLRANAQMHSTFLEVSVLERVSLAQGCQLGPYIIVSPIGAGGMGEVYRAHDPRLSRDVAVKILPSISLAGSDRLRRFEQEARAVAALNHPAILAVFDINLKENPPYLVSELLDGENLRERLNRGRLPQRKVVEYAVQIAQGLAEAHAKGVVHRDLKPENLFVTKDDRIKILDFGLAKLTVPIDGSEVTASTIGLKTEPGAVMGTMGYMSPEQARGQTTDHRTDIFVFGAILYEMLAGKRAFQKPTAAETLSAILNEDPPGITQVATDIPPALLRVAHRCLEKLPEQRFQSASDLAFALDALSDSGGSANSATAAKAATGGEKRWKAIVPAVAVVLALSVGGYFYFHRTPTGSAWVQLTNFTDSATSPALSLDGRMITFIRGPETFVSPGQIYVKLLPDGQPFPLTRDNHPKMAPVFSPEGTRVAYTATEARFGWNTWMVPVLGGEPREVLPNAAALTWIDKQHVLFSEMKTDVQMAIVTATESRSEERNVYVPGMQTWMAHRSWLSPDGKWVLVSEMDMVGWRPCKVVPFDGNSAGETVGPATARCTYGGWSPDGKWVYVSADAGDGFHIWRQQFRRGAPEQLTFGPTEEEGIAVTSDGRSLVTSVGIRQSSVWLHDANGDRQISVEGNATLPGLGFGSDVARTVFGPDGSTLFYLARKEGPRAFNYGELWMADLKSAKSEPVFPGILMTDFDLSPDGKRIAFISLNDQGNRRLWIAALDHRTPPQEVTSIDSGGPSFGLGGILYFWSKKGPPYGVYSLQPNDTTPRELPAHPVQDYKFLVSPDGKWWMTGNVAEPMEGGPSIRMCDFCQVGWGPGGTYFYIRLRDIGVMGAGNVYAVPVSGGSLPTFPPAGIKSAEDLKKMNVASVIDATGLSIFAPGPDPSTYAYTRIAVQRNLFKIPLT